MEVELHEIGVCFCLQGFEEGKQEGEKAKFIVRKGAGQSPVLSWGEAESEQSIGEIKISLSPTPIYERNSKYDTDALSFNVRFGTVTYTIDAFYNEDSQSDISEDVKQIYRVVKLFYATIKEIAQKPLNKLSQSEIKTDLEQRTITIIINKQQ